MPDFLARCDVLEDCFRDILKPNISIRIQFENFLIENFFKVHQMTEREFHKFIVKQSVNSAYGDFIKYIPLYLKLIVGFAKFYLFSQQQVLNVSEGFQDLIVSKRTCGINLRKNILRPISEYQLLPWELWSYVPIKQNSFSVGGI